jgi:hypothetical protein
MRLALSLAALTFASLVLGEEPRREALSAEQLAAWVSALGHEEYQAREEAQARLLTAGTSAEGLLKEAAETSADAEIRVRAARILKLMYARPRIEAATRELGSDDWEALRGALNTLCAEFDQGTGAEAALAKAASGSGPAAQMAKRIQDQWEQIARQKEQFKQNLTPENAAFLKQYLTSLNQNMKQVVQRLCRVEFDRRKQKPHEARKPALAAVEKQVKE